MNVTRESERGLLRTLTSCGMFIPSINPHVQGGLQSLTALGNMSHQSALSFLPQILTWNYLEGGEEVQRAPHPSHAQAGRPAGPAKSPTRTTSPRTKRDADSQLCRLRGPAPSASPVAVSRCHPGPPPARAAAKMP